MTIAFTLSVSVTLAFFITVCLFCLRPSCSLPMFLRCLLCITPADFASVKTQGAVMSFFLIEGDENSAFGFEFSGKLCFLLRREVVPCGLIYLGFCIQRQHDFLDGLCNVLPLIGGGLGFAGRLCLSAQLGKGLRVELRKLVMRSRTRVRLW